MRTAKTLIRLGECPGWSESSLGAQVIVLVLSCAGWVCENSQGSGETAWIPRLPSLCWLFIKCVPFSHSGRFICVFWLYIWRNLDIHLPGNHYPGTIWICQSQISQIAVVCTCQMQTYHIVSYQTKTSQAFKKYYLNTRSFVARYFMLSSSNDKFLKIMASWNEVRKRVKFIV